MIMAGKPKQHPVDGGWMTVQEAAGMLGLKTQQIYALMSNYHVGLQVAVNMVRQNLALNGQGRSDRYMVDGRWMTVRQAAEMLGVKPEAIRSWRRLHRDAQGKPATLQAAVDAYRQGVRRGGGKPVQHKVNGRPMTTFQAAEKLGVSVITIRGRMSRHNCSLAACVSYYEKKRRRRAEKQARQAEKTIMNILGY